MEAKNDDGGGVGSQASTHTVEIQIMVANQGGCTLCSEVVVQTGPPQGSITTSVGVEIELKLKATEAKKAAKLGASWLIMDKNGLLRADTRLKENKLPEPIALAEGEMIVEQ